jgi:Contractile injection system tube protein
MTKTQLRITAVSPAPDGTIGLDNDVRFVTRLNPGEVKLDRGISYNTRAVPGQLGSDAKFAGVKPDRLDFALLLDGTGVVPKNDGGEPTLPVHQQLDALRKVVFEYVGGKHEPRHVCVVWGSLIFYGRLTTLSTQFTLFKPDGRPLRAKVALSFVGFLTRQQAQRAANRQSPDLTHRVEVREGDTLPLLCHRVYGDAAYYPEVAGHNRLRDFRRLVPGTVLSFPPLG